MPISIFISLFLYAGICEHVFLSPTSPYICGTLIGVLHLVCIKHTLHMASREWGGSVFNCSAQSIYLCCHPFCFRFPLLTWKWIATCNGCLIWKVFQMHKKKILEHSTMTSIGKMIEISHHWMYKLNSILNTVKILGETESILFFRASHHSLFIPNSLKIYSWANRFINTQTD